MAKIAVEQGAPEGSKCPATRLLAEGAGWAVHDVVCGAGPHDRPFEELHSWSTVAVVLQGTFQYRSRCGREMMTPGSLLLGNPGEAFECGHEHATGDRCVSFSYAPEVFERIYGDADAGTGRPGFQAIRIPPLRPVSRYVARISAALRAPSFSGWEELGSSIAIEALQVERGIPTDAAAGPPGAMARVTRIVRDIEDGSAAAQSVPAMAREARLSPYHFLRTFQAVTGVTPHQYVLRMRLRRAALRIGAEPDKIVDIALDCGFGDVSNFNRAFRAEFGMSPRIYRKSAPVILPDLGIT